MIFHLSAPPKSLWDFLGFIGISGIALFSYLLFFQLRGASLLFSGISFLIIMISLYFRLYRSTPIARNSSTFFLILFLMYPLIYYQMRIMGLSFPGVNCVIPFIIFFTLTIPLKAKIGFPKYLLIFKRDKFSLWLLPVMAVFSAIALVLWVSLLHPDLTDFLRGIPDVSLPVLFALGALFALSNAFAEEMLFRGFLFEGLSAFFTRPVLVIFLQALLFGVWHFHGFPGGIVGSSLVFIWALFLGTMRHRSKSIWYPIIGHVFADSTIFSILVYLVKRHLGGY
jgi:membrane protease YdiL (CAAX protease family)